MAGENFIGKIIIVNEKTKRFKIVLKDKLEKGDMIAIRKGADEVLCKVDSMTIQGINVDSGFVGDVIEVEFEKPVQTESDVYKIL